MGSLVAWMSVVLMVPGGSMGPTLHAAAQRAGAMAEAQARAAEFDLLGAVASLSAAGGQGDTAAQIAAVYVRGLVDAREASRQGGSPDSLVPVRQAIDWLGRVAAGRPGSTEIARLMLQAAAAAAQSERDEMALYLDAAIRMERVQVAAGQPGAPLIAAAETAGDLWLQVHRYDEAREAYSDAAERFGSSMRILAGQGRAARGARDVQAACAAFRALLDAWRGHDGAPIEIEEARTYVVDTCVPLGR